MTLNRLLFSGGAALMALGALSQNLARADVVYDSIPSPLATNYPSVGYEADSVSEFGDSVSLAQAPVNARALTSATVLLSNWALESTYEPVGTSPGYYEPMTLDIYALGSSGPNPVPGSLIASSTVNAFIPWRPEASGSCTGGAFQAPDGCFNGLGTKVTFTFTGQSLPDNVIYGLSFNTTDYGANPTGVPGPYDSLNFAVPDNNTPSVGADINSDGVEWNTSYAGFETTGTAGVFGPDTDWTPNGTPAIELDAIPEPGTLALLASSVMGLMAARRRRRK
jgi:hypothetical protein